MSELDILRSQAIDDILEIVKGREEEVLRISNDERRDWEFDRKQYSERRGLSEKTADYRLNKMVKAGKLYTRFAYDSSVGRSIRVYGLKEREPG